MDKSLRKLEALRARKHRWYSVAQIIAETIEDRGWSAGQPAFKDWLAQAAQASGLSLNTLGRLLAVREFLDGIAALPASGLTGDPDSFPMSSLEVLKRIHAIKPVLAVEMLRPTVSGELSLRALRERHDALVADAAHGRTSDRALSKRAAGALSRLASTALQHDLAAFGYTPGHRLLARRVIARAFVHVDALVYQPDHVAESVSGICFISLGAEAVTLSKEMVSLLHRLCYLAGFFSRLIAIFPAAIPDAFIKELKESLASARRSNIALFAVADADDSLAVPVVKPLLVPAHDAAPIPDCRGSIHWERVLRNMLDQKARRIDRA
ncbi:MAG: hypothetical protein U1F58_07785 [Burkholderiales bacterium]